MEDTQKKAQDEKKIVEDVLKLKTNYEQATRDHRQECSEIFNAYMGKMDAIKQLPYKSHETIPKMRTEIAYVKPYIFSGEPEIEVEGVGDEDKALSKILEKIVNYRIQQSIPNAYGKIEDWVHQGVTFGTSLIKVVWRTELEESKEVASPQTYVEGEEPTEQTKSMVVVRDEPDLEIPNFLDVYYNPLISEVEDQPCLEFRSILTIEEVKENPAYNFVGADGKLNREKVEPTGRMGVNPYDSSTLSTTDIPQAQEKATDGMVEVIEKVDNEKMTTIVIGKESLVLRDTPHEMGFINAVKFVFEKNTIPNRFTGVGVGQNTLGLGKMYYQLFNQTLDNVKLTNNPMFMFAKGAGIDARQLVAKPGGGISVDAMGGSISNVIQQVQTNDIKQGAVEIISKVEDEHKRASGANDLVQGGASNSTLGQDQIAQSNSSNRFELIQRRFKHSLAQVAEMLIKLELQNLQSPDAPILRIFPEETRQMIFELLTTEAKNTKYNVRVKGETTVMRNKNLEVKRLIDVYNIASATQTATGPLLTNDELRAILRATLELQGQQNIDDIIAEKAPQPEKQPQIDPATGQPMMPEGQGMPMPQIGVMNEQPL